MNFAKRDPPLLGDRRSTTRIRTWRIVFGIALTGIMALFVVRQFYVIRDYDHEKTCHNNLVLIQFALAEYEAKHGSLPPVCIYSNSGIPMHSWRVLILPYLPDCEELYAEYRFDEPWNGANNEKLLEKMPPWYACPSDDASAHGLTSYVAVTRAAGNVPAGEFQHRIFNTKMLVVENLSLAVHWSEPVDIALENEEDVAEFAKTLFSANRHARHAYEWGPKILERNSTRGIRQFSIEEIIAEYLQREPIEAENVSGTE